MTIEILRLIWICRILCGDRPEISSSHFTHPLHRTRRTYDGLSP